MRKHALHLYLEELETVDSTFSGGSLPVVHSGCGSPLRVGITETGGKKVPRHQPLPSSTACPSEVACLHPGAPGFDILKNMSCNELQQNRCLPSGCSRFFRACYWWR